MKLTIRNTVILLMIALFAAPLFGEVWTPIGRGIPPETRNIFEESRGIIDQRTFATFIDDFYRLNTSAIDTTSKSHVQNGAAVAAVVDSGDVPGILKITTVPVEGATMNIQLVNANFRVNKASRADSTSVQLEYAVRVKALDMTQYTLLAGLCVNDTNLSGGTSDSIVFVKYDGSTTVWGREQKTNSATADSVNLGTLSADTWYDLRLVWNGSSVGYYVNGVLKGRTSTAANQPTGVALIPSFECTAGEGVIKYTYLDYIYARQRR